MNRRREYLFTTREAMHETKEFACFCACVLLVAVIGVGVWNLDATRALLIAWLAPIGEFVAGWLA